MALTFARSIAVGASYWTELVAEVVVSAIGWLVRPRVIQLIEQDDGSFAVRAVGDQGVAPVQISVAAPPSVGSIPADLAKSIKGARVELVLRPSRFLFRPLQLPGRATEFLDGIIRAQIDRLTPWTADEAVYGWSNVRTTNDRVMLTIAVTARTVVTPFIQFAAELGAASIAVLTAVEDGVASGDRITLLDQQTRGVLDVRRMSRVLLVFLAASAAATCVSIVADIAWSRYLQAEQARLAQSIQARRAAIRANNDTTDKSATAPLERRKYETAPSVLVLDALSRILPDHTHVTELRIEGSRVQIVGVTQDAPGLITLMEQSTVFTRATFFAPTTRSPSDTGERFHIEARIERVSPPT